MCKRSLKDLKIKVCDFFLSSYFSTAFQLLSNQKLLLQNHFFSFCILKRGEYQWFKRSFYWFQRSQKAVQIYESSWYNFLMNFTHFEIKCMVSASLIMDFSQHSNFKFQHAIFTTLLQKRFLKTQNLLIFFSWCKMSQISHTTGSSVLQQQLEQQRTSQLDLFNPI